MVDTQIYLVSGSNIWPTLDRPLIARYPAIGVILWFLAAIPGERPNLMLEWPDRAVRKIRYYRERCKEVFVVFDKGEKS